MRVAIFILSALSALIVMDAYLQASGIQTPMETKIDPHLGPTYIPHKYITRYNEGFYIGAANEYGYMGPAIPKKRVDGERRVLMLGDSYVLGHTVLPRHHYARTLEARLSVESGKVCQVLNFGKADFNLWNMYQYYHDFASRFDHDLALYFVDEGDLVPARQIATDLYPAVKMEGSSINIDRTFAEGSTYRFYRNIEPLMTHSAVLRLVFNCYKMIKRGELGHVVFDKLYVERNDRSITAGTALSQKLPDMSRTILENMSGDKRNILVLHKSITPELRADVAATGIAVIDLSVYLESMKTTGFDPYYWPVSGLHGHWNHEAHAMIGSYLANELRTRIK